MKILIVADQGFKPIKMYIDQSHKLAKGLIRLGHDARVFNYSLVLRSLSNFKSKSLSAFFYKKKLDRTLAKLSKTYAPDIIYISFARNLNRDTVLALREVCPNAYFIGGDGDPWPSIQNERIETAKSLDALIATNNGSFLEEYKKAGVENCYFMPNMCDPDVDHRYDVDKRWESDVIWTGTLKHSSGKNDDIREQAIKAISDVSGIKLYGCLGNPQIGGLDYFHAISGAKIGLHINAINDVEMYHSDRLTHYLACGTFVLCKRVPGSEKLFEDGKHLVYFDTIDDMQKKMQYYLHNVEQREQIADSGMKWVHEQYNSSVIAKYILDIVGKGDYISPWK